MRLPLPPARGLVSAVVGALLATGLAPAVARAEVVVPPGFAHSPVLAGLTRPIDLEFAPDGRLFITEQGGRVRIRRRDGTTTTFLDFSAKVDSTGERGMQSIAFDPSFATNHFVYLNYTRAATSTRPAHNRVVRVTAAGDRIVRGSEKLLLRLSDQGDTLHIGGAIEIGSDGRLYIATGDNGGGDVQSLGNLLGKILRINRDGTIPTRNPFVGSTTGTHRAIWALGLRNPFRLAVRPGVGTILVNDVGEDTWEEIDRLVRGGNYGWPLYEGPESDPAYRGPIHAYGHAGDPSTTGCAITGGTFYAPATPTFGSAYVGDYFFADLCNGWIRSLDVGTGSTAGFATGLTSVVDLEVSPDGALWYLSRGTGVAKISAT
jgi:glucose/arabinose dehydrogenase